MVAGRSGYRGRDHFVLETPADRGFATSRGTGAVVVAVAIDGRLAGEIVRRTSCAPGRSAAGRPEAIGVEHWLATGAARRGGSLTAGLY